VLPSEGQGHLVGSRVTVAEGRQMPEYQAYVIGDDGHVQQRIDLTCADDDAAKERAKSLMDTLAVELWRSEQKLATFEPDPLVAGKAPRLAPGRVTSAEIISAAHAGRPSLENLRMTGSVLGLHGAEQGGKTGILHPIASVAIDALHIAGRSVGLAAPAEQQHGAVVLAQNVARPITKRLAQGVALHGRASSFASSDSSIPR